MRFRKNVDSLKIAGNLSSALCLFAAAFVSICAARGGEAATTPANPGFTGLWEYPVAEMPADGAGRVGYTHASPYAFYFADLAWLPWLEVNARLTTFDNVFVAPSGLVNDRGIGRDYMDKAIDLKLMLHRSRAWHTPSLAFGVTDLMGTELMKAWYGVATWRLKNLAFSAGYGTDRMRGVFGGLSWDVNEWLTLKGEYSPLGYSSDSVGRFRPHPGEAGSKYNFGAVLRAPWGTEGSFSWQRGEEFVFSFSQNFDLSGPFLGNRDKTGQNKIYESPGAVRVAEWEDATPERLGGDILEALSRYVRVRDVEVAISERKIFVAYENYGHASQAEAMTRVLVILAAVSPHLDSVYLIPRLRGVPAVCAEFSGDVLFGIRARDVETKNPLDSAVFAWAERDFWGARSGSEKWAYRSGGSLRERAADDVKAMVVYEPRIDQTLGDDYQGRWSVDLIYEKRFANGWSAYADVRAPIYNDVDAWWEPDMNDKIRVQQAVISYLASFKNEKNASLWALGEAGWLDQNWFGFSQWGRIYSRDGRWWGGVRLGIARDRDPMAFAGLAEGRVEYGQRGLRFDGDADPWRAAGWLQGGYSFSDMGLDVQLDYGRFLDSDVGAKVSLVRRWDDSAVGFWMSRTDRLSPGKGFTATGIHLELPAEKWFGSWLGAPSSHIWEQEVPLLSTWRADAGRELGAWRSPERLLSQLRPTELKKNVEKLLAEYCAFETAEIDEPKTLGLTDFLRSKR